MTEKHPRGIVVERVPRRETQPHETREDIARRQPRTEAALEPITLRVAENAELMQRLRSVAGCEDRQRVAETTDEITKYAQTLDPSITFGEGTTIVVALAKMIGHFK